MLGCRDSCSCKGCELKFQHKCFEDDRPVVDASLETKNYEKERLQDNAERQVENYGKEEYYQSNEDGNEKPEPDPTQAYRMIRTTNQDYGMWYYDPFLRNKNWYKVKRFPIKSSYMTRLVHESVTGHHA